MVGGIARKVEHQPSKCKALSSNPNTAKKQNKSSSLKKIEDFEVYNFTDKKDRVNIIPNHIKCKTFATI
jgi:hypothetical protein